MNKKILLTLKTLFIGLIAFVLLVTISPFFDSPINAHSKPLSAEDIRVGDNFNQNQIILSHRNQERLLQELEAEMAGLAGKVDSLLSRVAYLESLIDQ